MNRHIFTIFKPTKINTIKSRLAIKCLCLEKLKFLREEGHRMLFYKIGDGVHNYQYVNVLRRQR